MSEWAASFRLGRESWLLQCPEALSLSRPPKNHQLHWKCIAALYVYYSATRVFICKVPIGFIWLLARLAIRPKQRQVDFWWNISGCEILGRDGFFFHRLDVRPVCFILVQFFIYIKRINVIPRIDYVIRDYGKGLKPRLVTSRLGFHQAWCRLLLRGIRIKCHQDKRWTRKKRFCYTNKVIC